MQQPRQLATWNPDRDLWETDQLSIFGPLVAYSETLPRSGMTRDGKLYELPMSAHRTTGRGFSLSPSLPTPRATRGGSSTETATLLPTPVAQPSGNTPENHLRKKPGRKVVTDLAILMENGLLVTGGELLPSLPTPTAVHRDRSPEEIAEREKTRPLCSANLDEFPLRVFHRHLLPTPKASDSTSGDSEAARRRKSPAMSAVSHYFPTPAASDATGGGANPANREGHTGQIIDAVLDADLWGKYAPAIARWEKVVGPVPAPTEPNSNGRPRLAAQFAEWMMGLPAGWVTDPAIGISRTHQLKAIGNGVCPQQALAALAILDPRQAA